MSEEKKTIIMNLPMGEGKTRTLLQGKPGMRLAAVVNGEIHPDDLPGLKALLARGAGPDEVRRYAEIANARRDGKR